MNYTPEPHHIPGYAGFTPQYRFRSGKTFAATTAQIFKDPTVSKSCRPVLVDLDTMTKDLCLFHIKNRYWQEKFLDKERSPSTSAPMAATADAEVGKSFGQTRPSYMPNIRCPPRVYCQQNAITNSSKYSEEAVRVENTSRKANNGGEEQSVQASDFQELKDSTSGLGQNQNGKVSLEFSRRTKAPKFYMTRSLTSDDLNKPRVKTQIGYSLDKNQQQKFYNPYEGMISRYQGHVPGEKFDFGKSFKPSTAFCLKERSAMIGY
ncbi:DgyrCDS14256 [Dimorphilus gyrociliatus]|uniref:DgyrCDS14256 n=1 Tax=Dimorphilus gyrociliatus TaxID=2664684 RepID=A0A7I8WD39_9ANNE|nr:DgyrCDS14256 [Dimorphilus gyrociliatus]